MDLMVAAGLSKTSGTVAQGCQSCICIYYLILQNNDMLHDVLETRLLWKFLTWSW